MLAYLLERIEICVGQIILAPLIEKKRERERANEREKEGEKERMKG